MDVGVITFDYLSSVLKNAADRLFEGKDQCLVPKRSGGNIYMYKIVGVMIGHSILHCGPPFNVLASWVYEIISGNSEENHIIPMIDKTMIPQNDATCTTIELIEQLDNYTDSGALNDNLDKKEYMQVINSSQWEPTHETTIQV